MFPAAVDRFSGPVARAGSVEVGEHDSASSPPPAFVFLVRVPSAAPVPEADLLRQFISRSYSTFIVAARAGGTSNLPICASEWPAPPVQYQSTPSE